MRREWAVGSIGAAFRCKLGRLNRSPTRLRDVYKCEIVNSHVTWSCHRWLVDSLIALFQCRACPLVVRKFHTSESKVFIAQQRIGQRTMREARSYRQWCCWCCRCLLRRWRMSCQRNVPATTEGPSKRADFYFYFYSVQSDRTRPRDRCGRAQLFYMYSRRQRVVVNSLHLRCINSSRKVVSSAKDTDPPKPNRPARTPDKLAHEQGTIQAPALALVDELAQGLAGMTGALHLPPRPSHSNRLSRNNRVIRSRFNICRSPDGRVLQRPGDASHMPAA